MEHFDGPQGKVKEKNLYYLQLSPPRIVLLSAVVIAVVVATFLLGMNFVKPNETAEGFAKGDMLFKENRGNDFLDKNIPMPPHGSDNKSGDLAQDSANPLIPTEVKKADGTGSADTIASKKDILTGDNIDAIIPPVNKKNTVKVAENSIPVIKEKKPAKVAKKKSRKVAKKRKRSVVPVSAPARRNVKPSSPYYAIQIASYDNRSRARSEMKRLKSIHSKVMISKKIVSGKSYYRVRIGPIYSKRKALDLLSMVQNRNRYKESYMIKE